MNPNSHKRPLCSECDAYECEPDETECKDCLIASGRAKCECCDDWCDADEVSKIGEIPTCGECLAQMIDTDETWRDFDRTFDR